MEKSIKLTVRAGSTWKISRTLHNHADGVKALAAVETNLHKHQILGTLTCKTDNGCSKEIGLIPYNNPEAVLSQVEEFMKSAGVLPPACASYSEAPESRQQAEAPPLGQTTSAVKAAHERGFTLAMKYASKLALEREEHAALEAARMQEVAYGVYDGLAHVQTVCDLLRQAALRARDMFGKTQSVVHTVLDPVIDAEEALQGMLHRLVIDAGELTGMLDAVADPTENAPCQTSDRPAQG